MIRDSKGRFCKKTKKEAKTKYQEKLTKAIKFILDNITTGFPYKKYTSYNLHLNDGYECFLEISEDTFNDLKNAYNFLKK